MRAREMLSTLFKLDCHLKSGHKMSRTGKLAKIKALTVCACLLAPMLSSISSSVMATEIYKWVDENGVTHYSARPPQDERNYEEVKVRNRGGYRSHASASSAGSNTASPPQDDTDENSLTQPGREVSVENPDKIAENCERARANIDTINSKRRVLLSDEDGGQRRPSDEERESLLKESQDFLDRWCDNG